MAVVDSESRRGVFAEHACQRGRPLLVLRGVCTKTGSDGEWEPVLGPGHCGWLADTGAVQAVERLGETAGGSDGRAMPNVCLVELQIWASPCERAELTTQRLRDGLDAASQWLESGKLGGARAACRS